MMFQILTHLSNQRCCGSKALCQAYQAEGGNRLCEENKVYYFDPSLSLDTRILGADSSRMGIGVGTPSRIIDLLDSGMS